MAFIDDIRAELENFRKAIENLIETKITDAKNIRVINGLSDISEKLGLIQSGEFRSGNGKQPGYGFSGVRIAYPYLSYDDRQWNIAGLNNDKLQFGIDATTGQAVFAGGSVTMGQDGMNLETFSRLITFGGGAETYWLGGGTYYGQGIFGFFAANISSSADLDILEEDFETGVLTGWTTTGNVSIYQDSADPTEFYCMRLTEDSTASYTLSGINTSALAVRVHLKGTDGVVRIQVSNTTIDGYLSLSSSWEDFILLGEITSMASNVLTITATNGTIYVDNVGVGDNKNFGVVGSSIDGAGTIHVKSNTGININTTTDTGDTRGITLGPATNNRVSINTPVTITNQGTTGASAMYFYLKDGKFILKYSDSGTWRYKYLDMTGTGTTWVHSTTEP
jgi:hypothetical protein